MELKETLQKPYTEEQRIEFIVEQNRRKGYVIKETETELQAWGMDANELLVLRKQERTQENDTLRDTKLLEGVTYNNVLFDSDTDQKINLSEQYKRMSDTDTVVWHGMNNVDLLCTKSDLQAIGDLIYDLTAFVWGNNAYIKEQIENAQTLEELEAIDIDYNRKEV